MIKITILLFYTNNIHEVPQDIIILTPNTEDSIIYRENVQFFFRRAFKP